MTIEGLERFERGMIDPATFDHPAHLRMAYSMCVHYPFDEALVRFARGLRALCARAGSPGKFHMTITAAFLSVVAQRRITTNASDWGEFIAVNADLLDRRSLESWYPHAELAAPLARETFVLPHRARSLEPWYPPLYVLCIVCLSAQTIASASGHLDHHTWLATIEIVSALGLLLRPIRWAALALLLTVFVLAAIITLRAGRAPTYLILYAASAIAAARMLSLPTAIRPSPLGAA